MEKNELVKQLYELRTGLLVLALSRQAIEKREEFDNLCLREKMYHSKMTDSNVISSYQYNCPTTTNFNAGDIKEWPAISEFIKMYNLSIGHIVIGGFLEFVPHYVFLFDHLAEKKLLPKYWKKALKTKVWRKSVLDGSMFKMNYPAYDSNKDINRAIDNFNMVNINVLKIKKQICEDALVNKNSALLKYYSLHDVECYFIPRINYLLEHRNEIVEDVENYCIAKYGIPYMRSQEQISADFELINEISRGITLLENKYSFISKSDWKDIDAILFFLESGRADTLKEALNLNDLKKYKEEIVASVDRVNRNIINGINAVRNDLDYYFNTMFDKLDGLNSSLVDVAKNISANTSAIRYSSNEICNLIKLY